MIKNKFHGKDQNGDPVFYMLVGITRKKRLVKRQAEGFFLCGLNYESERQLSETFVKMTNLEQKFENWLKKENTCRGYYFQPRYTGEICE